MNTAMRLGCELMVAGNIEDQGARIFNIPAY